MKQNKKMGRKILSVLLASGVGLSFMSGCKETSEPFVESVEVWTVSGTEKILRDVDYSTRYADKTFSISAFKNEYESSQIVISTNTDIDNYDVKVSELKNVNGDVLSADCFTVYHEKYINVTQKKETENPQPAGYYPDALLPMDVAKEYGEACVDANQNQAVWIELKTDEMQPAGVYTGAFQVTADEKTFSIPVSVNVYDYALRGETSFHQYFNTKWGEIAYGEWDSSVEMQQAYWDFLLDYRISTTLPGTVVSWYPTQANYQENFLQALENATKDERCTVAPLPYGAWKTITVDVERVVGGEKQIVPTAIQTVNETYFVNMLTDVAKYSAEKGINLFEKAAIYFQFLDEFSDGVLVYGANYTYDRAREIFSQLALQFEEELDWSNCTAEVKEATLHSLREIKLLACGALMDEFTTTNAVLMAHLNKYADENSRDAHAEYAASNPWNEQWVYTTGYPKYPRPTYHIDDVLISSRLMNWMCYDWGVEGVLYWDTSLYGTSDGEGSCDMIQDMYDTALRYPSANGDGYLLYPGKPYGMDGPVGTVRLQSIRDGSEDYELLKTLEEYYAQKGMSQSAFASVYSYLTSSLYASNACSTADDILEQFQSTRDKIAKLLILAEQYDVVMSDFVKDGDTFTAKVLAPESVTVKLDGNVLTGTTNNDEVLYDVTIPLNKTVNVMNLAIEKDANIFEIEIHLGGKVIQVALDEISDKIEMRTEGEVVSEKIGDVDVLRINYTTPNEKGQMQAQIDVSGLGLNESMKTITFELYWYGETETELICSGKCQNATAYTLITKTLQPGWNTVTLETSLYDVDKKGALERLRFIVTSESAVSLAIGAITLGGA